VLSGDPLLVLAWLATAIGLVGLALAVVTHWHLPWYAPRAMVLLAVAGIATLIWRMPHKREDPDDTGAQV
jgi:MFS superfamily sulfate permease-like transporter